VLYYTDCNNGVAAILERNMHTAQQFARKHKAKYINTHAQHAHIVKDDVAVQNAVNEQLYTAQQLKRAGTLKNKLTRLLKTTAYINLRSRFIAVKIDNAVPALADKANMQAMLTLAQQNKAELVLTSRSALILRLR
jgi:hypothetical protein